MDVCHCEMCAMLRTKDSSTYAKHTNVQEKESSFVNDCNVLKNGKVCFSENNNLWQMNLLQYRTLQFPEYVSNRVCDTHTRTHARTHVPVRVENSVLSFRSRNI